MNKRHLLVCGILLTSLLSTQAAFSQGSAQVVTPKKPSFLARCFFWVVRTKYGKPLPVTPEQQQAQDFLNTSAAYKDALARAQTIGFMPVPGQINHYEVPAFKFYLLFFKRQVGVQPLSAWVQGVKNADAVGMIVGAQDANCKDVPLTKCTFLTAENLHSALSTDRPKFTEYLKHDLADCKSGCMKSALHCLTRPIFIGSVVAGQVHAAAGTYVLCIAGDPNCGGCAVNGTIQALSDYVLRIPLPASVREDAEQIPKDATP